MSLFACGGDDSAATDASNDSTIDVTEEPEAAADVEVDAPPETAIWVATDKTLYKFDPETRVLLRVADFDCSGEQMIDLAMNAREELFGITTESVVRIDKTTGACTSIARGSQDLPFATAFIPATSLEAGVERWVGYKLGVYDFIDTDSGALTFGGTLSGDAGDYQASGDVVGLAGGRTYVTTFGFNPSYGDGLAEIDPNTGAPTAFDGYTTASSLFGLAQWAGVIYVFANDGRIYRANPIDGGVTMKIIGYTLDLGDAGALDAGDDADASSDASDDADAAPTVIHFRGAAVTTRAPTQ